MNFKYPKQEKLKSRKLIESLFVEGRSVARYPIRLTYLKNKSTESNLQISVSVSKKYFKKATDRNYYKRLLREAYRLNQHLLKNDLPESYIMMLQYQTKDRLTFEEVNLKVIETIEKFKKTITEKP